MRKITEDYLDITSDLFSLGGRDWFKILGNKAEKHVAVMTCNSPEDLEAMTHMMTCWNDRIPCMPDEGGEIISYHLEDYRKSCPVNIFVPDEAAPTWENVKVHFPAHAISISRQQLAELGHLFLALSTVHSAREGQKEPDPTVSSIVEVLVGFGFDTYVKDTWGETHLKPCDHYQKRMVNNDVFCCGCGKYLGLFEE